MEPETIKAIMGEIPQFDKMSNEERDIISRYMDYHEAQAGETLVREGSLSDSLFYIVRGQIEIEKENIKGNQAVLARFGKGSTVGEMSLVDNNIARSATARVVDQAELIVLTREKFLQIEQGYPKIAIKILKNIASSISARLRHTSGRFADFFD